MRHHNSIVRACIDLPCGEGYRLLAIPRFSIEIFHPRVADTKALANGAGVY